MRNFLVSVNSENNFATPFNAVEYAKTMSKENGGCEVLISEVFCVCKDGQTTFKEVENLDD